MAGKVYSVGHPGTPDPQLTVLGEDRSFWHKEVTKDVTYTMSVGYDCVLPQPDRDLGLWQGVSLRFTGPVDIRDPFIITDLPLPDTKPAYLTVSTELVNATASAQSGVLRGSIPAAGLTFEKTVRLQPRQTREVSFPQQVVSEPRLWWPVGLGEQPLYELSLKFAVGGATSAVATSTFGIRKVTKELYIHEKWPGLRIYINRQKVFSRGGWIQGDLLLDWDEKRMDAEVRYFAQANLNTVSNEDLPRPPDATFLAAGRKSGAEGIMNTIWADDAQMLMRMTWPGMAYGAAAGQQSAAMDEAAFFAQDAHLVYPTRVVPEIAAALDDLARSEAALQQVLGDKTMLALWGDPFVSSTLKKCAEKRDDLRQTRLMAEDAEEHLERALSLGA